MGRRKLVQGHREWLEEHIEEAGRRRRLRAVDRPSVPVFRYVGGVLHRVLRRGGGEELVEVGRRGLRIDRG